ncbi:MAG: hypothetical protein M1834_004794 [Cirrosporium novae-zelandiae]|nr:MAG: hypothetical protein M1834_004794 [Cirrosporium novae-zelandiae]
MSATQIANHLMITSKAFTNTSGHQFTAAFQLSEKELTEIGSPPEAQTEDTLIPKQRSAKPSPRNNKTTKSAGMSGYQNGADYQPTMYVQALYDYDADDQTSLSFRQGDIIQVLTQLESGWWDGVINGVRGWFPSNYCAMVAGPDDIVGISNGLEDGVDAIAESGTEDEYEEENDEELDSDSTHLLIEGTDNEQEEAAYWIPQATPDGRLFYFNTLTGVSTMELPMETPTSANETGPRDRMNVNVPEQTRPPPELMAGGYERDEDEDYSYSEAEGDSILMSSRGASMRKRSSIEDDAVSSATSMASTNTSPLLRQRTDSKDMYSSTASLAQKTSNILPPNGVTMTSFTAHPTTHNTTANIPRSFFDDGNGVPNSWAKLVENIEQAVEAYREVVADGDRSEFVRKAEDISDHLRMLLAAGSGTTDNHSGNSSIIQTNKALYPHFRDMMSRFSKLVLSSHMAAADWPGPDSYSKCLQEADGVLRGVYGYVEVARQQRGDDIPRLVPGFVVGGNVGGSWQNNNLTFGESMASTSFMDQDDYEPYIEPTTQLDEKLLERMDELKRMIVSSMRKLDEQLKLTDKIVTAQRHEAIGNTVCSGGRKVIEFFRPWISTVESVNLGPLGSSFQNPQLTDFSTQKQRLYDLVADLMLACQAVAGPLGDEWAGNRGDPLEDRLNHVRTVSRQLETCVSQVGFSLQLLLEQMAHDHDSPVTHLELRGRVPYSAHGRSESQQLLQRPQLGDIGQSHSFTDGFDPAKRDNSKIKKFFGELPAPLAEETPWFLTLDHEGEISYDTKVTPQQLRAGTLTGLVEQLTRHDRLDASFNNTFLLTYRSFTTASELFEMLVKRFSIQPPYGLTPDDYPTWEGKKQKPIRFRVVNILKSWFDNYWMEGNEEESMELLKRVYSFAKDSIATTKTPGSGPLMALVEQRLRGQDANAKRLVLTLNTATPTPILPKNMKKLKFLDIDATEFARQLTIIESRLYGKIKPTECLNKTWQRKIAPGEPEPAANVKALILHSNQLTNWVAEMILTQSDVKKRVVVIKHFVAVADKCRVLNNFSTLTSIISALGTAPIARLHRTWQQVNARTSTVLEQMRRLMGSTKNFGEYREALHVANPPCIPFFALGVYLTDLTFIEDGIPSIIKKTNLINFAKRAKTAEVIRDIQQYQNVPYPLQPVPELQDYILNNMQAAGDVHEMYDKSLAVEPREREDEKIARYASRDVSTFGAQSFILSAACV